MFAHIQDVLGDQAEYLLGHTSETISKTKRHHQVTTLLYQ